MKMASWNVNSLRVRLEQVLEWLELHQPDVLVLQETKVIDADFPAAALKATGYHVNYSGQKTYNGVAILTKLPLDEGQSVVTEIPGLNDPQKRVLALTVAGIRIVNVYVPNGSEVGSEKYLYKLNWLEHLHAWVQKELQQHERCVILGDFNIAPADEDVYDPKAWEGSVLVSAPERAALAKLLSLGLVDVFRQIDQAPKSFTWFDYRGGRFWRNEGLRIDLILASQALANQLQSCEIDLRPRKKSQASDHAPIIAVFA